VSYADALSELKASFGDKKLLTIAEVAPHLGNSATALAKLRSRGAFPLPIKKVGASARVSIYDLARFVGEPGDEPAPAKAEQAAPSKKPRAAAKAAPAASNKPTRRPPSLGRTLRGFGRLLADRAFELDAQRELFFALEAVEFDRAVRRKSTRQAPPRETDSL